jgi:hypothetical protein
MKTNLIRLPDHLTRLPRHVGCCRPNFRDVTAERIGERIALVGPPQRVKPKD